MPKTHESLGGGLQRDSGKRKSTDVAISFQQNYEPNEGDESFLAPATERTKISGAGLNELILEERKRGFRMFPLCPVPHRTMRPAISNRENEVIGELRRLSCNRLKATIMPNAAIDLWATH
jgi:formate C-acetyltransferase